MSLVAPGAEEDGTLDWDKPGLRLAVLALGPLFWTASGGPVTEIVGISGLRSKTGSSAIFPVIPAAVLLDRTYQIAPIMIRVTAATAPTVLPTIIDV